MLTCVKHCSFTAGHPWGFNVGASVNKITVIGNGSAMDLRLLPPGNQRLCREKTGQDNCLSRSMNVSSTVPTISVRYLMLHLEKYSIAQSILWLFIISSFDQQSQVLDKMPRQSRPRKKVGSPVDVPSP